ncbi:MAG TPA: hypothetical protein VGC41_28345, partial [Kofleriaceae bacterium]
AAEQLLSRARTRNVMWLVGVTAFVAYLATRFGDCALPFGIWLVLRGWDLLTTLRALNLLQEAESAARFTGDYLVINVDTQVAAVEVSRRAVKRARANAIPTARVQ